MSKPKNLLIISMLTLFMFQSVCLAASPKKSLAAATIYLKNGNGMSCQIKSENKTSVTVIWEGMEMTLKRSEIKSIDTGKKLEGDGMVIVDKAAAAKIYKNNPVVHLQNGQIIDGKISDIKKDVVVIAQDLGGGAFAYQDIPWKKIEKLDFKVMRAAEDQKRQEEIAAAFPKMKSTELGFVTLFTDTDGASLKEIKKMITDQCGLIYSEFFELFKDRSPQGQIFVVAFDQYEEYAKEAAVHGVPAQMCPGFFDPQAKTLFMMNFMGDQFSGYITEAVAGVQKFADSMSQTAEKSKNASYALRVQGLSQEIKERVERALSYIRSIFSDIAVVTLRHEITHGVFNNFGLQSVDLSKSSVDAKNEAPSEDKKQFIMSLLEARSQKAKAENIVASNSWFVEGTAEYASTTAAGLPNDERLYLLKETKAKNELWPLSQLTVFKMGSFPGICSEAMLSGYAQSWGFVGFLMKNYHAPFLKYLKRISSEKSGQSDDYNWLLEALGKDAKTIEKEWSDYIDTLPKAEDPLLEQKFKVHDMLYER